ncbi:hypothetical protein [Flavobacterium microcysteis]
MTFITEDLGVLAAVNALKQLKNMPKETSREILMERPPIGSLSEPLQLCCCGIIICL